MIIGDYQKAVNEIGFSLLRARNGKFEGSLSLQTTGKETPRTVHLRLRRQYIFDLLPGDEQLAVMTHQQAEESTEKLRRMFARIARNEISLPNSDL
jgi:hypothetical protein